MLKKQVTLTNPIILSRCCLRIRFGYIVNIRYKNICLTRSLSANNAYRYPNVHVSAVIEENSRTITTERTELNRTNFQNKTRSSGENKHLQISIGNP